MKALPYYYLLIKTFRFNEAFAKLNKLRETAVSYSQVNIAIGNLKRVKDRLDKGNLKEAEGKYILSGSIGDSLVEYFPYSLTKVNRKSWYYDYLDEEGEGSAGPFHTETKAFEHISFRENLSHSEGKFEVIKYPYIK